MAKVKTIPEGYHALTPFLNIEGAEKAIEFYKKAFGAEERYRMPGPSGKLMHAELQIGDSILMLADAVQEPPAPAALHLYVDNADAVFERAVAAGAKPLMPPADMFWGDRFGRVVDPFGVKWSIATHKEDVPPDEMKKRMQAAVANK